MAVVTLRTACPKCSARIKVQDHHVGKQVRCPSCSAVFEVSSVHTSNDSLSGAPAAETMERRVAETHAGARSATAPGGTQAVPDQALGTIGRFQLRQILGQGAFGRVYRAYDPQLDREVALKVPTFGPTEKQKVQRFVAEAKSAARLRHPNIVPTFESGQVDGQYYIAAQFVPGEPLSDRIEREPPDFRQAAEWVRQLAEALAYAHSEQIVHRDIKPANIMIDHKGVPQIMDFGLAKRLNDDSAMTTDGSILGSPAYMSPEQASGRQDQVGPASDQYSLGVVLYELLCRQRPFSGSTAAVIAQVREQEPESLRKQNSTIPRDLETICLKSLAKEVGKRYLDCQGLAEDLRRWLHGEPVTARWLGLGERLVRWFRRNPAIAVGGSVAGVGLAAVAIVATVSAVRLAALSAREQQARQEATDNATKAAINEANARRDAELAREQTELAKQATTREREARESERIERDKAVAAGNEATLQAENARTALLRAEAETARARHLLYSLQVNFAQEALQAGSMIRALDRLNSVRPAKDAEDLRGFEWYYLWKLCNRRQEFPLKGGSATFSPVNNTLAVGPVAGKTGDLVLFDIDQQKEAVVLQGDRKAEGPAAFSPDGKWIAAPTADRMLCFWETSSGDIAFKFPWKSSEPKDRIQCLAFSPDGKVMAYSLQSGEAVFLLDPQQQKIVGRLDLRRTEAKGLSFSADSRYLAASGGDTLRIFDLTTKSARGIPGMLTVEQARFAPLGTLVAEAGSDGVRLLDSLTGKVVTVLRGATGRLLYFRNEHVLITAGSHVQFWDATSGHSLGELPEHRGFNNIQSLSVSSDGQLLAIADAAKVELRYLARSAAAEAAREHKGRVIVAEFSQDGSTLLTAAAKEPIEDYPKEIVIWDTATGKVRSRPEPISGYRGSGISLSRDGKRLATAFAYNQRWEARVWDTVTGQTTKSIPMQGIGCVALSEDGKYVAYGGSAQAQVARIWDLQADRECATLPGHKDEIRAIAFSPDGKIVATGGQEKDSAVRLWQVPTGKALATLPGHQYGVRGLRFAPDGKTLIVDAIGPYVWDVETGKLRFQVQGGARAFAISSDSKWIATGEESRDVFIRVRNLQTGEVEKTLTGHTREITSLAFLDSAKSLASASLDGTVKTWDLATGQERATFKEHTGPVHSLAASPDGKTLVSGGEDSAVVLRQAASEAEVAAVKK